MANGTVKFVATTAKMTGYSDRPVMFAYFRNTTTMFGVTGLWNYLAVYSDDGSPVGADIFGGSYTEVDVVYGTAKGIIAHEKPTGLCYEQAWDASAKNWYSQPTACPQ